MKSNIDQQGRRLRAMMGIVALVAGAGALFLLGSMTAGLILVGAGLFMLFEAAKGWCLLRACGIHTKI